MQLVIFLTGFLSGVALRSIVYIPQIVVTAFTVASFISLLYTRSISQKDFDNRHILRFILFLVAVSVGVVWYSFSEAKFNSDVVVFGNDSNIKLMGVVDEIPVEGEYAVSARAKIDLGYVMARFKKGGVVAYGDRFRGAAVCKLPESFETDTGTVFDYRKYLMARGMHHVCVFSSFEVVEQDAGNYIQARLYEIRLWFSGHIDRAFGSPHAGLVKGVLLGDKSGLGLELKKEMTVAGVIHIAVLSGSNIAMVAAIIFGMSTGLHYNVRIVLSVTVVILFVLLSGAEPPAVRAGILVVIMFLGKFLHRKLHTGRALLLIASVMVAWNPFALIHDMSFQLSFLATIGIVYVAPIVDQFLQKMTQRYGLREIIAGTLGAQITVTPLILFATGALSIVSLPANVLIGWAVPVLMMWGFFGGILHVISGFIAMPIVFLGELFSGYIIAITKVSAHLPYAQILVPINHPLILCGMYVALFLILKRVRIVPRKVSS